VTPRALTWDQIRVRRLSAHHLLRPAKPSQLLDVVSDVCNLQAQVMSSAELAAAVRSDRLDPSAVSDALWEKRTLVKTWAQRGTLHLLSAEDFALYAGALSAHTRFLDETWLKYFGFEAADIHALIDAAADALDGRQLTREQLTAEIVLRARRPHLREHLQSGWGSLLKPVAFRGLLCFGPNEGRNVTFVRPDQWLGGLTLPDPDDAFREILRRYLRAYGPATLDDFARWWGAAPKLVRPLFKDNPDLVPVESDHAKAWTVAAALAKAVRKPKAPVVRLLPGFDPFVLGGRRAGERPIAPENKDLVWRKAAWVSAVLLVDGELAGVWEVTKKKDLEVRPFWRLDDEVKEGVIAEARRLAPFVGEGIRVVVIPAR
jgi:hypothetical protein